MMEKLKVQATDSGEPFAVECVDDQGHRWVADEPVAVGGGNTGPAPKAMLLGSLGACTVITLRMYAQRKQWPLTQVRVELSMADATPSPAAGTDIERKVFLQGDLDAEQRERLLQVANACPVHKLLSNPIHIATTLAD